MIRPLLVAGALAVLPLAASAQGKWKAIGTTATGNAVSVDPRSVKRTGNLVAATVRVVFKEPVQTPQGPWGSSRTTATFDCAKQRLAAKENVIYATATGGRVVQRTVNRIPGYGPALKGSLGEVAMTWLCRS